MLIYGKMHRSNKFELSGMEKEKFPEIITDKTEISLQKRKVSWERDYLLGI
jgi:hypothetical protein